MVNVVGAALASFTVTEVGTGAPPGGFEFSSTVTANGVFGAAHSQLVAWKLDPLDTLALKEPKLTGPKLPAGTRFSRLNELYRTS